MTAAVLRAQDLSYTFVGRQQPTLSGINLEFSAGSWTVLTGVSGSGKSTLLRVLAGLIPRHSAGQMQGRVLVGGLDTRLAAPARLAAQVGLALQSADDQLCASTVTGELAFGLENLSLPAAEIERRVLHGASRAGLDGHLGHPVEQLSGGQKQRLLLSAILAMQPRVLLLDEPLSQLDPVAAAELLDQLEGLCRQGMCVVMVEHRLEDVLTRADRMLALAGGQLTRDIPTIDVHSRQECLSAAGLTPPALAPSNARPLTERTQSKPPGDLNELLSVKHLTLAYRQGQSVLEDVAFALRPGDRLAVIGANGCGKSTLLTALSGLMRPIAGKIERPSVGRGQVACGLLMQNPDLTLFCSTVYDELAYGPRQAGCDSYEIERRVRSTAAELELSDLLDEPPLALSQGERLRAALGAILTLQPRVLLLDEPTTGQDPSQRNRVLQVVADRVRAGGPLEGLLFSSHDLPSVKRLANRVLILANGRVLAEGAVEVILNDRALLEIAGLSPARFTVDRRVSGAVEGPASRSEERP